MTDIAIVGGGPAGSSLAIMLGRRGFQVELYEQARFPRDKPCGEGLLPAGVDVLRELGVEQLVGGRPLLGVQYHVGERSARAEFAPDAQGCSRYGLGQRRLRLDETLWNAAAATPGVQARQGHRVTGPLIEDGKVSGVVVEGQPCRARWVVAADGSASTLRRRLGLEQTPGPHRLGVRAHFRLAAGQIVPADIQIFLRHGYEIYVTPLPEGEVLVALLSHRDAVSGSVKSAFRRWLQNEPKLMALLEGAEAVSEIAGRAPLMRATSKSTTFPNITFLGDAATSVDPITAGGMSLALVSSELLAREVPAMLRGSNEALARFESRRAKAVRIHRLMGGCLLSLGRSPRIAGWALSLMRARKDWMDALVDLAAQGPTHD